MGIVGMMLNSLYVVPQTAVIKSPQSEEEDVDIDAILDDLKIFLERATTLNKDKTDAVQITQVPQLSSYIRFLKQVYECREQLNKYRPITQDDKKKFFSRHKKVETYSGLARGL